MASGAISLGWYPARSTFLVSPGIFDAVFLHDHTRDQCRETLPQSMGVRNTQITVYKGLRTVAGTHTPKLATATGRRRTGATLVPPPPVLISYLPNLLSPVLNQWAKTG